MSFEEFRDGFLDTLQWREYTGKTRLDRATLDAAVGTDLDADLLTFWTLHGTAIESARGIPGFSKTISWHAGHELCFARNDRSLFREDDWGKSLADAMNATAATLGKCSLTVDPQGTIKVARKRAG